MSTDGPRTILLSAALLAAALGARAAEPAPLPLVLERPADASAATVAVGPPALHLVFFATWCSPCVEELRKVAELESRWAARGYRLVLVAVAARQSHARLQQFTADARPPGEVLFDAHGSAQRALGVEHLPTHILIDRSGTIVHRSGAVADGVGAAVEQLLARTPGVEGTRR